MFAIMKNLTILGALFLSMTILFSCNNNKDDDKKDKFKKEIEDPCDIIDYTIEIFEELKDLADDYDDIDDLEDDTKDKKKVNAYFDDLEDAWKYAFNKVEAEEMMEIFRSECRNSEDMEESMDEIKDFYEERMEDFLDFIIVERNDLETEYYEEDDYDDEWFYEFAESFMRECTSENSSDMYDYCECALEEIMDEYTPNELENLDPDEALEFIVENTDCLELIDYDEY